MAIKLVISNTVKFTVKGTIKDDGGIDQPFSFTLTAQRLDADAIPEKLKTGSENNATLADFFADLIDDWSGVKDEDDKATPYSADALKRLFKIPGIGGLTLNTYLQEVGAKAKN